MLWKVGLKEQRERKNKSKVTQELVKKITRNTSKKRRESLTQMKKKKGKQQGERIWETRQNKMIENGMFSRYVKEGKKSLKYT